ncbi:hypothetical protein PENTCL1PPCAC_2391, partial [Pristionchus entomophagus]
MGDHGQRMHPSQRTFGGRIEERQPLMSLLLPRQFRVYHPSAYAHLLSNAHRLTSNVDIHETLLDIIDNRLGKTRPKGRGRSLFTLIPKTRSCMEAWIPKNFCLCQYNATDEHKKSGFTQYSLKPSQSIHFSHSQSVRMGLRSKGNWSTKMEERINPKGFFTSSSCSIRSHRNLPLYLLVRTRVDDRGRSHSIPFPPMIEKVQGE